MKSTIKIALGAGNEPAIHFNVRSSDDVRDQLCCQWLHGLQFGSNLAHVNISPGKDDLSPTIEHILEITPLPPNSHWMCTKRVEEIYDVLAKDYRHIAMITGSDEIYFENTILGSSSGRDATSMSREELRKLNIVELVKVVTNNFNNIINEHTN